MIGSGGGGGRPADMGRPSTPGPGEGGGDGEGEGKAGSALWMVIIGLFSLVLGIIAVAAPYWGTYSPPGIYSRRSWDGRGHFGPFKTCQYTQGGYGGLCNENTAFRPEVYLLIAGICGIVGVLCTAAFTMFAGLYCAMKLNNKKLCLKFDQSTFCAFTSIVIAELATILAVGIGGAQFSLGAQQHRIEIGYCYILEIVLIIVNLILTVMAFIAYKKAKKCQFPKRGPLYEISSDPSQQMGHGIAVTHTSGNPYLGGGGGQHGYTQAHLVAPSMLPQYPAPTNDFHMNGTRSSLPGYPNGNGYNNGYSLPTGQIAQPQTGRAPVPGSRSSPGINMNPEGRVNFNPLSGPGHGSMDSLNSTQSSVVSAGSIGSFSSNASINNPMRSSLKKPKNKENNSIASGNSKKSVTIAIGTEQTQV